MAGKTKAFFKKRAANVLKSKAIEYYGGNIFPEDLPAFAAGAGLEATERGKRLLRS
jgi:hypothetical protein